MEKKIKPLRLEREFRIVLTKRVPLLTKVAKEFAQSFDNIFPPLGDFIHIPEVKAIIHPRNEEEFTTENFQPLLDQLPTLIAHWKRKKCKRLDDYLKQTVPSIPVQAQCKDFALAHLVYCNHCGHIFSTSDFSAIIHDRKDLSRPDPPSGLDPEDQAYWQAFSSFDLRPSSFSRYAAPFRYVSSILDVCGKGPLTTVQELDDLDPRFVCAPCSKHNGFRTIYTWRDAVSDLSPQLTYYFTLLT